MPLFFRLLILSILALAVPALGCEAPLRVFASHWPPYVLDAGEGASPRFSGIDVARVNRAFSAAGCAVEYVPMPTERANLALRRGEVDVMMAASMVPERHAYAWFSIPYRQEVVAVIGLEGAALDGWDEILGGKKFMLAPRYGYYGTAFEARRGELLAARAMEFYDSYDLAVAMLKAGRADYLLGDMEALEDSARRLGVSLSAPLIIANDAPVHLMYSRESVDRETVERIDRALHSPH